MDSAEFRKTNDDLARRFDVGEHLERSHFLIRFVELKRIRFIMQMINSINPGSLLDVGCGDAFLLEKLKVKNGCGIDLSPHNIASAKKRLKGNGRYLLLQADAESIPFDCEKFDAVVCSEVIEHVQHPESVLREIARVLKRQGTFIITIPNDGLANKCKKVLEVLGLKDLLSIKYGGAEEWHLRIFNKRQIRNLLLKTGFKVIGTKYAPFCILPLRYIFLCEKELAAHPNIHPD